MSDNMLKVAARREAERKAYIDSTQTGEDVFEKRFTPTELKEGFQASVIKVRPHSATRCARFEFYTSTGERVATVPFSKTASPSIESAADAKGCVIGYAPKFTKKDGNVIEDYLVAYFPGEGVDSEVFEG